LCCNPGTFSLELVLLLFYLKCKIVRTCDFFHYLTPINLETFQRIYVTKVTCTDNFPDGHNGLSCRHGSGRYSRHDQLNDLLCRAFIRNVGDSRATCTSNGKRPDGVTQIPCDEVGVYPGTLRARIVLRRVT